MPTLGALTETDSPAVQVKALAREQMKREAEEAMAEYLAQQKATLEKTERLRAMQLSKHIPNKQGKKTER
jgi:hypothetical protein